MTAAWFDVESCLSGRPHLRDVASELPGTVIEVPTAADDEIRPGQVVVVLESMKMEIPVLSEHGGRLADVTVSVGDVVSAGDRIALLRCCEGTDAARLPAGVRGTATP